VATAAEAFTALQDLSEDAEPLQMQSVLQKAAATQAEANAAITAARTPLKERLDEAKAEGVNADTSDIVKEFQEMLEKLTPLQEQLDEQRRKANEKEHKFVAACLMQEATEMFEVLDEKLKRMNDSAAPLLGKGEELLLQARLGQLLEALRRHAKETSKSAESLFKELAAASGTGGNVVPKGLPAALKSLQPELPELSDILGNTPEDEKCLVQAFSGLIPEGESDETVTLEKFSDELQRKYLCVAAISMTDSLEVANSKTVRKLEVGEILEHLGEAEKEKTGLLRVRARAVRDQAEGYVTLAGSSGTTYLEVYTPFLACVRGVEEVIAEVWESVSQTSAYLKQKQDELRSTRGPGPLEDLKKELWQGTSRSQRCQEKGV